jgi:hypothetical protein
VQYDNSCILHRFVDLGEDLGSGVAKHNCFIKSRTKFLPPALDLKAWHNVKNIIHQFFSYMRISARFSVQIVSQWSKLAPAKTNIPTCRDIRDDNRPCPMDIFEGSLPDPN